MKLMFESKQIVSGIMAGILLFSLSPTKGIEAAILEKKDVGALGFSNTSQYMPVNRSAFNLIQNSPVLYASIANKSEKRVIVTFRDKKKDNKSLILKGKGKIKRENKHTSSLVATMTTNEIETLKNDPTVESIETDIQLQTSAQTMEWGVSVVNATYAWNNGYTGKGIKIAVLDSGINIHHEDLVVAGGTSIVDYTTSYDDDFGHGTHVAGIIGAKNNDIGVVGVAPDADLYAVKVLDSTGKGYLSDVIAGIDWAIDNKIDIINMSMVTSVDSQALHKAVDQAYANGLLVVAAAGNTGNTEGTGNTIQYPAKYNSVISVGAVDQNNQRASFSATGSELEIVAPGVGINSTYLNNGYSKANGTSVATSYVAGELALLKQESPKLSNLQLRNLLDTHVSVLDVNGKDTIFGYGLMNIANTSSSVVINTPDPTVIGDVNNSVYGNVYAAISPMGIVTNGIPIPLSITGIRQSTLKDGRIFVTGYNSGGKAYIFDTASNIWSKAADFPAGMISAQSALNDGRVMVTGNIGCYIYNPINNSWTRVADLPMAYESAAQSTLNDGKVMVTGGYLIDRRHHDIQYVAQSSTFIYDPQTNKWLTVANLSYPLYNHAQSTLVDGRVMVTGGVSCENCDSERRVIIYDPVTNTWTPGVNSPITGYNPPYTFGFSGHSQVTLLDGRVFIINNGLSYLFDFKTNTWTRGIDSYQTGRGSMSVFQDGRVFYNGTDGINGSVLRSYIYSFNLPPTVTVENNNQTLWSQPEHRVITLSGKVVDNNNDNLTVSASINGVTKTTIVSNTKTAQNWLLQWDIVTDNIPAGTYTNISINVNDGIEIATNNYTGSIIVELAPYAPSNVSPGNTISTTPVITNTTPTLSWIFSDPDVGDTQSAYDVLIYNGTSLISDSGWVSSAANSYTVPEGKLTPGTTYSWLVKVKDSKGAISPNSALLYIRINTLPTLSLTSYVDGQQVPDNVLKFTWSYADADGQIQKAYQVVGSQDNWATVGYNSGNVTSADAFMLTPALASGTWDFKVLVSDGFEWSTEALRRNLLLPNAFEPNDSTDQAYSINYNQRYTSLISTATDVDYFKYTASSTGVDRFAMTVPIGLNYDVYIYDSSLNLIAAGVRGAGLAENVLYDVTTGNTYYIKLVGAGGNCSTSETYGFTLSKLTMQLQTNYQYDSNGNIIGKTTTKSN